MKILNPTVSQPPWKVWVSDKSDIKKGFLLVHTLREGSTVAVSKNVIQLLILQPGSAEAVMSGSQSEAESHEWYCSVSFLLFIQFGEPQLYRMVPLSSRSNLPTSTNLM